MSETIKIQEVQSAIETALQALCNVAPSQLPESLRPLKYLGQASAHAQVSYRHSRNDRQVKRTAPLNSWDPLEGTITISYVVADIQRFPREPEIVEIARTKLEAGSSGAYPPPTPVKIEDRTGDLILALAEAERDPQFGFVALKWFRDSFLPYQGYDWAVTPEIRHKTIAEAISKNWILTAKVSNPRNPQFPVTAIRLNKILPEVRKILDLAGVSSTFAPIAISGESLSATVLRERR